MQDLLDRLSIQGATIAQLTKTLERISRNVDDFPEGEDLGPLQYELKQDMKSSAIATQSRGFTPVSTKSKAPQSKAIAPVAATDEAPAPIVDYTPIDLSAPIDWASMNPDEVAAKTVELKTEVARLQAIVDGKALQKQMLELQGIMVANDAETVELDRQLLTATEDLQRQQLQNSLRKSASPELMEFTSQTVTAVVNDDVARTKAALGKQQELSSKTPNQAEISAFRAELLQSQRWNEAAGIQNSIAPLAIVGASQQESEMKTIAV